MHWTFGKGTIYPGGRAGMNLKRPEERPAIISDDGVTILWEKNIPEPGIITIVYQKHNLEFSLFMKFFIINNDFDLQFGGLSACKTNRQLDESVTKTDYMLSAEEIGDMKRHLREALPLWEKAPDGPFPKFRGQKIGKITVSI